LVIIIIHVDNEKEALGLAIPYIQNSIGYIQHDIVSGPTHCHNHNLDLTLTSGIKKLPEVIDRLFNIINHCH